MIHPADAALTTVRGFQDTPAASADEDSDYGLRTSPRVATTTPRRSRKKRNAAINDVVSANCSPSLRPAPSPAISGITKLRMQMEPLTLDSTSSPGAPSMSRSSSNRQMTTGMPSPLIRSNTNDGNGPGRSSTLTSVSTSRDRTGSSNLSGDETGSEATTSYEIDLDDDFVSESLKTSGFLSLKTPTDQVEIANKPRKMTTQDFEPVRCLGKGTYGTVLLVKQRGTGRLFAQKQFKKASLVVHKKLVEQTKTERQILESVNRHPFVVKLFYAFQDKDKLYLILEYGQGGELFTHLSTERMFSQDTAAFYMAEMVLALTHLHNNLGVVYRDLKPENCLLDAEGHLLLTDFGLSKVAADDEACKSMLGTTEYMSPEVVQGQKYGKAVDWWSFGAMGYDLMTGSPPFRGPNRQKIQDNIVKQKLQLPYFLGPDAKDLLTRLLQKNPKKRLVDPEQIKKHRFFRKIDWKKLAARELTPPIQPLITDPELAENFSDEFTNLSLGPIVGEQPELSPLDGVKYVDLANDVSAVADDSDGEGMGIPARGRRERRRSSWRNDDPFGGFSFVASSSLLEEHGFRTMMAQET